MTLKRFVRAFALTGVALLVLAANSSATSITYNTDASTGFGGSSLILNSTTGGATLEFLTVGDTPITVPSQINYGYFVLTCDNCTTTSGAAFPSFTFDMVVTDVDTGAYGTFVGTSAGGTILSNSSNLTIAWAPVQLGPGTLNAALGTDFGQTFYTNEAITNIVAPNSGFPGFEGVTTVQGFVDSEIPEPATLSLIGFGLLGLGFLHRRRTARS